MPRASGRTGTVLLGAIFLLMGIVFLFSSFDIIDAGDLIGNWWPSIIILVAVIQLVGSRGRSGLGPWILLFIGLFLQAVRLDVLRWANLGALLAVLLIVLGIWAIFKRPRHAGHNASPVEMDTIDEWVIFGGTKLRVTSQQFQGGRASAFFGGHELDLRSAKLGPGDIQMTLLAGFGGIDVAVPADWEIVIEANPILGGVDDKRLPPIESQTESASFQSSRLFIRAIAVFGGIDIKT